MTTKKLSDKSLRSRQYQHPHHLFLSEDLVEKGVVEEVLSPHQRTSWRRQCGWEQQVLNVCESEVLKNLKVKIGAFFYNFFTTLLAAAIERKKKKK